MGNWLVPCVKHIKGKQDATNDKLYITNCLHQITGWTIFEIEQQG